MCKPAPTLLGAAAAGCTGPWPRAPGGEARPGVDGTAGGSPGPAPLGRQPAEGPGSAWAFQRTSCPARGVWTLGPGCTCCECDGVCECACTGGMQSRVSPVACRPPHSRPGAPCSCRSAWLGAQEPRGLRDPTPGRASSLPLAQLLTGFRGRWFFSFGFHSFMEKDSGKRKGEEQLKGETEPRGSGPCPSGAT